MVAQVVSPLSLSLVHCSLRSIASTAQRFNVVALVVIPVTEPDGHFMVITSSGERYYYSTTELGVVSEFARPSTFRYMSNPHNPIAELGKQDIDCVLYSGGCLVMSTVR